MKRAVCFLLVLCMLILALPIAAADSIYFVAINDSIPFNPEDATMPFYYNSTLYVDSSVFTDSKLGIFKSYTKSKNILILGDSNDYLLELTFDISSGTVTDKNDREYQAAALVRGGVVFVSVSFVCNYFGFGCSYLTSADGWPIVRITNGNERWEDTLFVERAEILIADKVKNYQSGQVPTAPPSQSVEPAPSPSASSGDDQPIDPGTDVETPEQIHQIYLSFRGDASQMEGAFQIADKLNLPAVYCFEPDQLEAGDDLIRQIYSTGGQIALSIGEGQSDAAAPANEILGIILKDKTRLIITDSLSSQEKEALADAGYLVWTGSYVLSDPEQLNDILAAPEDTIFLQIDCDAMDKSTLASVLLILHSQNIVAADETVQPLP